MPGANLRTVGTIRDAQKWPKRDNRKDPHKLDQINFNLLSPYTVQKMWRGREVLNELVALSGENTEVYGYRNCKIRNSSLKHGVELYTIGIQKFLGNSLISRLEKSEWKTMDELRKVLRPDSDAGTGDWVDMAGLIAPRNEVKRLLDDIQAGALSLSDIQARLEQMHAHYYSYEWTWALEKLEQVWGCSVEKVSLKQLQKTVKEWQNAVVNLDKMVYNDARKEFDLNSQTGFGVDGDRSQAQADFEEVRGPEVVREATYEVAGVTVKVAVTSGLGNARKLVEKIKNGEADYHMVEIMACPGGCINGGGQPTRSDSVSNFVDYKALRSKALYDYDKNAEFRVCDDSPVIKMIYDEYFEAPGKEKAHHYLHTSYTARDKYYK